MDEDDFDSFLTELTAGTLSKPPEVVNPVESSSARPPCAPKKGSDITTANVVAGKRRRDRASSAASDGE